MSCMRLSVSRTRLWLLFKARRSRGTPRLTILTTAVATAGMLYPQNGREPTKAGAQVHYDTVMLWFKSQVKRGEESSEVVWAMTSIHC